MKDRVYVCHTFYHVYISVLKELNLPNVQRGKATLVLSTMSNDFGNMTDRVKDSGLFAEVYLYDEQRDYVSEKVMKYHRDKGNVLSNMFQRMLYTKLLGKLQEDYVPVDFKEYKDIYVYCDGDPISYYLNYKRIHYHAVEDGLNTVKYCDDARFSNKEHFRLKVLMASMNLIFVENAFSKYCLDMEVNDISVLKYKDKQFVEVPRDRLVKGVAEKDFHYLTDIFLEKSNTILTQIKQEGDSRKKIMILTEPLCDLDTRKQIFLDIVNQYIGESIIIIKPHPRDELEYNIELFSDCVILDGKFPMEIMNYIPDLHVDTVVSIFTVPDGIRFADEKVVLGPDFMDKYEAPSIHRQMEQI